MDPGQLPSSGDFQELADHALDLADLDLESYTLPEVLEAIQAFCSHPVTVWARRICDLVALEEEV